MAEHLDDPRAVYLNIYRALRPGGKIVIYVPNKFPLYALANAAMPNQLTKFLLSFSHWGAKEERGFPALHRRCYTSGLEATLTGVHFKIVQTRISYRSEYCTFFLSLHAAELGWQLFNCHLELRNLYKGFTPVAQKEP